MSQTKNILLVGYLFTTTLIALIYGYLYHHRALSQPAVEKEFQTIMEYETNFQSELISEDLRTYEKPKYSNKYIETLVISHQKYSREFNVPIGLGYAIGRVESENNPEAAHSPILVGEKTTRAVGLMGIVWEYWADTLRYYQMAEERIDLFFSDVNVRAGYCILRSLIQQEFSRAHKYNIVDRIVKRYYGAFDQNYRNKLTLYTSDLWMKRISKQIMDSYDKLVVNNTKNVARIDSLGENINNGRKN